MVRRMTGNTCLVTSCVGSPQRAINLSGLTVATASSWRLSRASLTRSTMRSTSVTRMINPQTVPAAPNHKRLVRSRRARTSADDKWRRFKTNASKRDRRVFNVGSVKSPSRRTAPCLALATDCQTSLWQWARANTQGQYVGSRPSAGQCSAALQLRAPRTWRSELGCVGPMRINSKGPAASRQNDAMPTLRCCTLAPVAKGPNHAKHLPADQGRA